MIPLNSPPHCPRYNGAKECGFRELKEELGEAFSPNPLWKPREDFLAIAVPLHHRNHRPRPCLRGRVACAGSLADRPCGFLRGNAKPFLTRFQKTFGRESPGNRGTCRITHGRRRMTPSPSATLRGPATTGRLNRGGDMSPAAFGEGGCHDMIRVTLNNNKEVSTHFDPQKCS
ncbi:MAG: hypothetical protein PHV34_22775 [Verrucomicrobiae bacterium]|nr:hypothetical protein [Verrucomicrobiae bacterium]